MMTELAGRSPADAVRRLVIFFLCQDLRYDIIILSFHTFTTTISVPLPAQLLRALEDLVKQKRAPNKAAAMRLALEKYLEDEAVQAVLRARKEPSLEGDIDELAAKL